MKIQHLVVESDNKQGTYKIRALKPKNILEERKKHGSNLRDGNFPHHCQIRRRKLMWNIPYPMRTIRWTNN